MNYPMILSFSKIFLKIGLPISILLLAIFALPGCTSADFAPKTVVPKTVVPKTVVPKTVVPKTVVPKTVAPKTVVPKTVVPKTVVPKTVAPSLAAAVEKDLKVQWGVTNFSDGLSKGYDSTMLNWYISSISDHSAGTITVTVQITGNETTKDEVKLLSKRIMMLEKESQPKLQWVIVQTADGSILEQTSRNSVPF